MWVNVLSANSNYSGMLQSTVKYYNTDRTRMVWQFAVDGKYYISVEPYPNILIDGVLAARQPYTNHVDYVWKAGSLYLFQYSGTHSDYFMICDVLCGYDFNDTVAHPYWRKGGATPFGTYTRVPAGGVDKVVSYSVVGIASNATLVGQYSDGTVVGWETLQDTSGVLAGRYPGFSYFLDKLPQRNSDRYFHANLPGALRLWRSAGLSPAQYVVVYDPTTAFVDPPPSGIGYWKRAAASGLKGVYTYELNGSPGPAPASINVQHLGYDGVLQVCDDPTWYYGHAGGMVSSTLTALADKRQLNYR